MNVPLESKPASAENRARKWFSLILVLYFLLGMGYSVLIPIWEAPDEPNHYLYALSLARQRKRPSPETNIEAHQPPLYYWIASLPIALLDTIDPTLADYYQPGPAEDDQAATRFNWNRENFRFLPGPQLLRWLNLAIGGATVVLIYRAARALIPDHPSIALGAVALASLTPQFLHISTSISNDVLANLAGALLLWLIAKAPRDRPARSYFAWLAPVALLLPWITKFNLLPVGLGVGVLALWMFIQGRERLVWKPILIGIMILAILIVGFSAFFPAQAAAFGDEIAYRALYVRPDFLLTQWDEVSRSFAYSFWGYVGWVTVRLPGILVLLLTGVVVTGLFTLLTASLLRKPAASGRARKALVFGLILIPLSIALVSLRFAALVGLGVAWQLYLLWKGWAPERLWVRTGWWVLWLIAGLSALAFMKNFMATPQHQGRYLFPSIGVISILTIAGWHTIITRGLKRYLLPILVALMVVTNLIFWIDGVLPVFFQPFLD